MPRKKIIPLPEVEEIKPLQPEVEDIFDDNPAPSPVRKSSQRVKKIARSRPATFKPASRAKTADGRDLDKIYEEHYAHDYAYTNPSPRFYRSIAIGFLAVTALVVLGVVYLTGGKTTITLTLKVRPVKAESLVSVVPKVVGNNQVSGAVLSLALKKSQTFAIAAGRQVPAPAIGKVIIYNQTCL